MQGIQRATGPDELPSWEASVSTWIGGEGERRPEELDTPYGSQVWDSYHLIGDVLRNSDLAIKHSDFFSERISKAIAAAPPIVPPRMLRRQGLTSIGSGKCGPVR